MSRESWTSLAERVERAGGADREIDARVWQLAYPEHQVLTDGGDVRTRRPASWGRLADFPMDGWKDADGLAGIAGASKLTASVDAVLALISETLPGWDTTFTTAGPKPVGTVWSPADDDAPLTDARAWAKPYEAAGDTAALALLAAYCFARAASVIEIAGSGERDG